MLLRSALPLLIGPLFIAVAIALSSSRPELFLNAASLLLVLGGCAVAVLVSYPIDDLKRAFRRVATLMRENEPDESAAAEEVVEMARLWHRQDLQQLERRVDQLGRPFLRTAMQMLLARSAGPDIHAALSWRIRRLRNRDLAEARVFHALANYAPAFGMLGTLIGLVNLMLAMHNAPQSDVGFHWAIALITTFYGILLANLIFRPIATQLERRLEKQLLVMAIVLEGIKLMTAGRTPGHIRESLLSLVAQYDNELNDTMDKPPARLEPQLEGGVRGLR